MTVTGAALATAATTAGTNALFKAAADRAERTLKGPAKSLAVKALAALSGYSSYLSETNERVSTFKTFADPTRPVSLLEHFVDTKFFPARGKKAIDQNELLTRLRRPSRFVISATAGFGKSMVMRYLALAMYENPMGKIPIFLELRQLNRVSSPDIVSYINSSYRQSSEIQAESFKMGLQSGSFVLLLDGFDELNHDVRPIIEDQILNLARTFPSTTIVISGRPDDRFKSWKDFSIYEVQPMDEAQVVDLINKLDYDVGVRKRFVAKVRGGLYESHKSFMSTPLLAILMLLTFEQNANIPDKMHLFYSEAFRTLFHKHDALKEQYDRSRKSGLAVDEFEKVFAAFCLKTYVIEKVEFTHKEIIGHIKDAIRYEGHSLKPEDFLFDIEEAVCLFVKEGNSFFFVHRSFQEYFTALFLSTCAETIRDSFIDQISSRYWDNVLPMLFDMSSDQLIPTWITRRTEEYLTQVGFASGQTPPLRARFTHINLYMRESVLALHSFGFAEEWKFISVMMRFYPSIGSESPMAFEPVEQWGNKNKDLVADFKKQLFVDNDGRPFYYFHIPISCVPNDVLHEAGIVSLAEDEYRCLEKICLGLDKEQKVKNDFLNSLFKVD